MSSNTVAQFAQELKMPANVLLEQLRSAGIELKSVDDAITDSDKAKLLESLRRSHGSQEGNKITLTRRQTSEIRQDDGSGRSRTIQVETRKKRVFVKRDPSELVAEANAALAQENAKEQAAQAQAASQEKQAVEQAPAAPVSKPVDPVAATPEAPVKEQAPVESKPEPKPEPEPEVVAAPEPTPVAEPAPEPAAPAQPVVAAQEDTKKPEPQPQEQAPAATEPSEAAAAPVQEKAESAPSPTAQEKPVEPTKSVNDARQANSVNKNQHPQGTKTPTSTGKPRDMAATGQRRAVRGPVIPPVAADVEQDQDRDRARKAAEAEAAALRDMLNRPRKVLRAPEPEADSKAGAKGAQKKDAKGSKT
ncbi:translation initiation factor IF-2 associated domain-containing protein, partial [Alcaligenes nematophilus]|uniref:translation initiation factor IF-2 associated domain-containing protein n=1 Tax=Alcaligenes nematophilus TaxID=2994643 RepID=UPI00245A64AC